MDYDPIEARLRADGAPDLLIQSFRRSVEKFVSGYTGLLPEAELAPLGNVPDYADAASHDEAGRKALEHTVLIKLNGGLGTSMGLEKAKSLLPVRPGYSFLDVLARQVMHVRLHERVHLPLLLMNSFSTDHDTREALASHVGLQTGHAGLPLCFCQHRVPKLRLDDRTPVSWPDDPSKEWCPPGHGDLYLSLATTGLLDRLVHHGYRYAFVSNVDNLGAVLDTSILGFFAERKLPFLMEVTDRTEADRKGGHLARKRNGSLVLREVAMCPLDEMADFQDVTRHRFFNTNNLWINLPAIKDHLERHGGFDLGLIVNKKTVDPRLRSSPAVVQLETAMGSALSIFPDAMAIRVPRTRFAPVKTTEDLLALWSDAYELRDDGRMVLSPARTSPPNVRLDPGCFRVIDDFERRFQFGAPSLIRCDSITIEGDFRFGRDVVCTGRVMLKNPTTSQKLIPDGTVLSSP